MPSMLRVALSGLILLCGLAAQAGLETMTRIDRPPLRGELASIPLELGGWVGHDEPLDPEIERQTQATSYLNRVYESPTHPGRRLALWISYSIRGDNLRHSPEICLPSKGYKKLESETRVLRVPAPGGKTVPISRLGYSQGELVQGVGFWYYIFGEGRLEHYVRSLPITSRSSHGRTTRGSSLTVEVFDHATVAVDDETLREFAAALLQALEPVLPEKRDLYFVP